MDVSGTAAPRIWLHGASVGDARALGGLLARLQSDFPSLAPLLTVGRAGGREAARRWYPGLDVRPPPLPFATATSRFLRRNGVRLLVLEYLELWPGFVAACDAAGVPVVVVDGHVTHRSLRIRPLLHRAAGRIALFCAQTAEDATAAAALGVPPDRIHVTGNGKHDRVTEPASPSAELRAALGRFDVVVGSLNRDEESALAIAFRGFPGRMLVAPRDVRRAAPLVAALRAGGASVALRSTPGAAEAQFAVLDTVGELAQAYALGRVALVGGTFCRREGQNLIEPASHGLPVVHGPRTGNIRAETLALDGRGAIQVASLVEAAGVVQQLLAGASASIDPRPALLTLTGAVGRQTRLLRPFLDAVGEPCYSVG